MSTPQAEPDTAPNGPIPWTLRYGQALDSSRSGAAAWMRASQHLMRGLMETTLQQIELNQGLIGDALTDLQHLNLGQARGPDDLIRAELDFAGRQAERFINAARQLNDSLRSCYFDAAGVALGNTPLPTPNGSRNRAAH